ncbi:ArsR/SmtB family transcription factor [Streptomyces sp. NPDC056149]|uniref:ArsR/SmtB family transcription factor n=1 Tax=unclassified Streptomyces TaxID=2593676 RepID=UPI002380C880|nr:helix-turn-helix domain-containing protein [Streptomyces sp. WZ-12]
MPAALFHPTREQMRLEHVLEALANPIRLRVVRTLAEEAESTCGAILPDVSKSTASHHWRVLRESGLVHQRREGRHLHMHLRREDLDSRFPGLLDSVLRSLEQQEGDGRDAS